MRGNTRDVWFNPSKGMAPGGGGVRKPTPPADDNDAGLDARNKMSRDTVFQERT